MATTNDYDVIIVGSGIAGAIVAYNLGKAGKKVLILEAGPKIPADRSNYMETFFKANAKTPESPYPPSTQGAVPSTDENPLGLPDPGEENTPRYTVLQIGSWRKPKQCYFDFQQQQPNLQGDSPDANFAYGSSYERIGGGTTWHWLGTSLRFLPNDFILQSKYGVGVDWPGGKAFYEKLVPYYEQATNEINVAGSKAALDKLYQQFDGQQTFGPDYDYPMPAIVESMVDRDFADNVTSMHIDGEPVYVTPTPQGRNSRPGERRQCAGNTNCIPICPIQAKYDATVTIARALQTGNVEVWYQHVVSKVLLDPDTDEVSGVEYITYAEQNGPATGTGTVSAKKYVMAAHAIETPKLLLMSKSDKFPNGVANSSGQVGKNLMDHIMYLAWGLAKDPVFPYRGPLSTSGIESVRDGAFRSDRAAYRIEIGNEGWQWATGDPFTTLADYVFGQNNSQTNATSTNGQGKNLKFDPSLPDNSKLFGQQLVDTLNGIYTRQVRLGYLIEQLPYEGNSVELSETLTDNLGLPRPKVNYQIPEDYVRNAFVSAKEVSTEIFDAIGATEYTQDPGEPVFYPEPGKELTSTNFQYQGNNFKFYGAGHIVGTYRMGTEKENSVLNDRQQSWDHSNLYMVGSGVFPTLTTANPTLTIAALAFNAADNILEDLES
ncbi:GMC family oxidoreductase [Pseudotenacibaculum haliotis]|uniref:GMC family oxidoreductase n=1 Tax=Pseudotenacibaculum haliotis TaxID=1862138 RepID=A0ABW5LT71_9FLAO